MKRQIKFRVWDNKQKEFIEWKDIVYNLENKGEAYLNFNQLFLSKRYIPLQFTELLDRNGKEIFEGDICDGRYGHFIVKFENGGFWPLCGEINTPQAPEEVYAILGNIYENPELLK